MTKHKKKKHRAWFHRVRVAAISLWLIWLHWRRRRILRRQARVDARIVWANKRLTELE